MTELLGHAWSCVRERRVPWSVHRFWTDPENLDAWRLRLEQWRPSRWALGLLTRRRLRETLRSRPSFAAWRPLPECPRPLYDAGSTWIGRRLFVLRGYETLGRVSDRIFVFDMATERWTDTIDPPARLAHSHAAVCSDGARFLYSVSGQLGSECHPAITDAFSYDDASGSWHALPPLPAPRYAGTMQLLDGRLHFVGGALPDRYTPAADHWSLAVSGGVALEDEWRVEPPVPLPAMHRGSVAIGDALYLVGGQQGDYVAIPGDPSCRCTGRTRETYFPDVYRFRSGETGWTRLRDMPIPVSHTDTSVVHTGGMIHVVGGQIYKDPVTFRLRLTDAIQSYDVAADRWVIGGFHPYRVKMPACGIHQGGLFCTTGQGDRSSRDDAPGRVRNDMWRMELASLPGPLCASAASDSLPSMRGKEIVLITHELSATGAPLLLLEAATAMRESGASVRLFSVADDATRGNVAERHGIPVLPIEDSVRWASRADLVMANTCLTGSWIRDYLAAHPSRASRLVWWIHENQPERFASHLPGTDRLGVAMFDSRDMQAAWEPSAVGDPARRFVVHPGNRDALRRAAASERLPWPLGAPGKSIGRAAARARLGLADQDFLLCCIGTVSPRKGQALLLEAVDRLMERHPDLRLHVMLVGFRNTSQRRAFLHGRSARVWKAVHKAELLFVQRQEISIFYRVADAFVMNSQERGEPFGRVTIEAMQFGLPVLGTNAGGTREIVVDQQTGLLHPVGAEGLDVLGANILRLMQDRAFAKDLGMAGRRRAEEYFTAERFFRQLDGVLARVLAQPECDPAYRPQNGTGARVRRDSRTRPMSVAWAQRDSNPQPSDP